MSSVVNNSLRTLLKNHAWLATILPEKSEVSEIAGKHLVRSRAILKALQVLLKFGWPFPREGIDHPILIAFDLHHSFLTKISQVLGDLNLGLAEDGLEVTDAERRLCQQLQDSQTRSIAETSIDLDQVHPPLAAG